MPGSVASPAAAGSEEESLNVDRRDEPPRRVPDGSEPPEPPGNGRHGAAWTATTVHRIAQPAPGPAAAAQGAGPLVDAFGPGTAQALGANTASSRGGVRDVLRVVPFLRLWVALAFSSLGDWLGLLATTGLAVTLGGRAAGQSGAAYALGGVLLVRLLPSLVLGPFAGAVADRFDRRRIMVVADVIRAALYASIPLVHSLLWLTVATFLAECVGLFWIPAKEAAVPNLLEPGQLTPANQLSLITTYGSAPFAAVLYALLASLSRGLGSGADYFSDNPQALALFADAATFAYGAYVVLRLPQVGGGRAARVAAGQVEPQTGLVRDVLEGLKFVGGTPLVRGIAVGIVGGFVAVGSVAACGRLYVANLGGGDAAYGLLFGAVFSGLALGMAFGPRLTRRVHRTRVFGLAISGAGLGLAVVAVLPNILLALVGVIVVGFFAGLAWVDGQTMLGREVANEVRGRTFAIVQSLVRVTLFAVLAAAPFLVGVIGPHAITLSNGSRIRADGATLVMLGGGVVAAVVGIVSYRQMDDRREVSILGDLLAAARRRPARLPAYPGLFIAVEGGEGSGKSSQARLLADWLRAAGRTVVVTREPGATPLGVGIRALLLDPDGGMGARAEALLYAADRAEHVASVVLPALRRGEVVVSDRYVASSLAYQGAGRALGEEEVERLSEWATEGLVPDVTVLLDVDPARGLARAAARGRGLDRLEGESLAFHHRVRTRFVEMAAAGRDRWVVVEDGVGDTDAVHQRVRAGILATVAEERIFGVRPVAVARAPVAAP